MNQEKIGKTIKEIRQKSNLTQSAFAEKYNVTYQAVSKWENGKNLPDMSLLKQICDDYNIDINDLLDGNLTPIKNKSIKYIIFAVILLIIIFIITIILLNKKIILNLKLLLQTAIISILQAVSLITIRNHQYIYLALIIAVEPITRNIPK